MGSLLGPSHQSSLRAAEAQNTTSEWPPGKNETLRFTSVDTNCLLSSMMTARANM